MPTASKAIASTVSADNIIEGSRKRVKLEQDANNSLVQSPSSSTSRLPDGGSGAATGDGASIELATELGFKMLDVLINRIDEDNQPLTVPFLALPSRSDYPDYYEMIKNPISLEQIRRRLQNREYESFEQVRNALESICRNAKRYNQKGSEIYEKSRVMHQIILHAYIDLVEKGDVQPIGSFVLKSNPPLQEQSAKLAKLEKPARRARLDYDEVQDGEAEGKVSLRLKNDDDIDYEEDMEDLGEYSITDRQSTEEKSKGDESLERQASIPVTSSIPSRAKEERDTPVMERSMDPDETDDGNTTSLSQAIFEDGDIEMLDGRPLDRSMLTLAGKFDRRKRPGPRGKRLKSTLRTLVVELLAAVDHQGQAITRFFRNLPSRLQYPDYYKVIQRPIALDSIEDKVHKKGYANPYALIVELRQMVDNAQYYNEEGSEIWEAGEQVRQYIEGTVIPTLLADGFTLDPNDMRQSALPVEIQANSNVPAQIAAFKIQMERKKALENGTSNEYMESVSPEIPSRSLGLPNDSSKFKVRLNTRGNTLASPGSLAEIQPPPPSIALGMSLNDSTSQMMAPRGHYSQGMPSQILYPSGSSAAGLPQPPYLAGTGGLPHTSPPMGSNVWSNGSSAAQINTYSSQFNYSAYNKNGRPSPSTTMLPPSASYNNGSLPFQKPTAVQLQGSPGQNTTIGDASAGGIMQNLSKRLPGDAPPFDAFKTNGLKVNDEISIIRHAVIPIFDLHIDGKDSYEANLQYHLKNNVTRIHSVSVLAHPPELLECHITMTLGKRAPKEGAATEEIEEKPWTVSIYHNGKGIRPKWPGQESNALVAEDMIGSITPAPQMAAAAPTTTTLGQPPTPAAAPAATSTRTQVPQNTTCNFSFIPNSGANTISVNIHPPPPHPGLVEIVKDDKHPLRSKAKALLDLPERYRIFVYCQS